MADAAPSLPPAKKSKTTNDDDTKALAGDGPIVVATTAAAAAVLILRCNVCQKERRRWPWPESPENLSFALFRSATTCAQCDLTLHGHLPYCQKCDPHQLFHVEHELLNECERCRTITTRLSPLYLQHRPFQLPYYGETVRRRVGDHSDGHESRRSQSDDDDEDDQRECYTCGVIQPQTCYSLLQWNEPPSICSYCFPIEEEHRLAMDHYWEHKDRFICDHLWQQHGLQCYGGDDDDDDINTPVNIPVRPWDESVLKKEDMVGTYDLIYLSFSSESCEHHEYDRLQQRRNAIGTLEIWDDPQKPFAPNNGHAEYERGFRFQGKGNIDNAYSTGGLLYHKSFAFGVWTDGQDQGMGSIRDNTVPLEEEILESDVTLKWITKRTVLRWIPNDHAAATTSAGRRDNNNNSNNASYAEYARQQLLEPTKINGLPDSVLKKVHEYRMPRLELVLEKGDLCLEIAMQYYSTRVVGKLVARRRR